MESDKKQDVKGSEVTKKRKVAAGPVREKSRTMEKLVAAVGKVIQKHGYPGLTVANIGKASGLDRKLIYTYFGSLDKLVEAYIVQKDYWRTDASTAIEALESNPETMGRDNVIALLQGQLKAVYENHDLQKILHWEIGETNKVLRQLADSREELGELLLKVIDLDFEGTGIDLRAMLALQISGIYYLCLHANANGSTFCGIDINTPMGMERIGDALRSLVTLCYEAGKVPK
jgi:AcrR family transcriptional regulator